LTKPNIIVVKKIDLNIEKSVHKDLGNLAQLQQTDPRTQRRDSHPTATDGRYRLWENTVFCRELRNASERKPVLPICLEERAVHYAHTSLGHLGADEIIKQIQQVLGYLTLSPNRSVMKEERSHLQAKPGSLCSTA
jgi:hypothetical protein